MKHLSALGVAIVLLLSSLGAADGGGAKKREALVDQVKRSIDRGIGYLRRVQRAGGNWEIDVLAAPVEGGESALTMLALLNAGVPVSDPMMARGMTYLRGLQPKFTYVRALQTMVFVEAGQVEDRERIAENVRWLIEARVIRNGALIGWSYRLKAGQSDNSNTQYALLGLHSGKQAGVAINEEIWRSIRDFYVRTQVEGSVAGGAGWSYVEGQPATLTMTTAGLCGLLIAGMELNVGREVLQADGTFANCGVYKENEPAAKALKWIGPRFQLDLPQNTFYNLYGIERAGRLSGLRFIGGHDWYREGCQYLVRQQKEEGSWEAGGTWDRWPVVSTSFALLFLSKGRTPILISKLVHTAGNGPHDEADTDWNNDRNDLRHLTEYASRKLFNKLHLAWQIFDMRRAASGSRGEDELAEVTSDMLQSPIVYFNGHKSPRFHFQPMEKTLLKKYVENGGFILAEACCGSSEFDRGFKKLAEELWPDTPLEALPATHPIWYAAGKDFQVTPGKPYKLLGINMGCKTVLVYSPEDLSCYWEAGDPLAHQGRGDGRGILAFRLGVNIIAYATGMEPPRPRLTHVDIARDADPRIIPRGYFKVAQLKFNGDYKPAPYAMRNLMDHMRKFAALDVVLKTEEMPVHVSAIKDFKFIYLHGRGNFRYADEELGNLRFNLENGGVLFADACCGQETFDKSFRKFAAELFPKHKLERIPLEDILFSKELNGEALTEKNISCRQEINGTPRHMAPWLEGIKIDGRWAVVYSKYDIGCALERHQSSDCRGYTPDSALKLATAGVLYTLRP
jgi:hypothetical protein